MHPDLRGHALGREQRGVGAPHEVVERAFAARRRRRRPRRSARRRRAARAWRPGRGARSGGRRPLRGPRGSPRTRRRRGGIRARRGSAVRRAAETARMRSSPTAWPSRSFVFLRSSRSSMTRQTRPFASALREILVERAAVAQAGQRIGRRGLLQMGELGVRAGARTAADHAQQREERRQQRRRRRGTPISVIVQARLCIERSVASACAGGDALGHVEQLQSRSRGAFAATLWARVAALPAGSASARRSAAAALRVARHEQRRATAARGAPTCGRRRGAGRRRSWRPRDRWS